MKVLHVFLTALGAVISLFLLTKIMGRKQMSQLSMFDYIVGISLGSIAAEMATSLEEFYKPLTAMIVFALMDILISIVNYKSIKLRRILVGKSIILLQNGTVYEGNLKKAKMDINEFLSQCRSSGYFSIDNLQSAVLEPNGKISFLPKSTHRPVTPYDLKITPSFEKPEINVILDGKVIEGNLKYSGNNLDWLETQLKSQGISKMTDVFLATCDNKNMLHVYLKHTKPLTESMFE